jgi:hypothetical protein
LIVVLDEKFGGVAGIFLGITEQPAAEDQVAGEDRGAAFPD